jgi:hypothetical protein
MIFIRQKHFLNPQQTHRSRSRAHHQRRLQHQQILRQSILNNTNSSNQQHRTRETISPHGNTYFLKSIALNEKLASFGGLFGAVNIIITGFLLYYIFISKPEVSSF